jgi:hypothetical protein
MLIATFGPTTGWVGKTIVYEDRHFLLEGHGPIRASDVLSYAQQGFIAWASAKATRLTESAAALEAHAVGRTSRVGPPYWKQLVIHISAIATLSLLLFGAGLDNWYFPLGILPALVAMWVVTQVIAKLLGVRLRWWGGYA